MPGVTQYLYSRAQDKAGILEEEKIIFKNDYGTHINCVHWRFQQQGHVHEMCH